MKNEIISPLEAVEEMYNRVGDLYANVSESLFYPIFGGGGFNYEVGSKTS